MEIIKFDIIGKFAHFRKFYSNNSALSYSLPPRTSIMGLLAALAGFNKDSFYENLSSHNLNISVFSASPIKKTFHRLNTLKIKGLQDFRGKLGHTQTPIEIVSGFSLRRDLIKYTIYLENLNLPNEYYDLLLKKILDKNPVYNLSLGLANFTAWIDNPSVLNAKKIFVEKEYLQLYSAANIKDVLSIDFREESSYDLIEEETMPADFDKNRKTVKLNKIIYTLGGKPLKVKLTGNIYVLSNGQQIQMLD